MSLRDWLRESTDDVRERGWDGLGESAYQLYLGAWKRTEWVYDYGQHVYDEEWDLLVVLDACRYDLATEVEDEYDWLSVESSYSVGGASREWIRKTFGDGYRDEVARTAYVTGNPFSDNLLSGAEFALLDEVWERDWDYEAGTIRPNTLTDRAIHHHRERDPERMVVHYMQPHHPFVADPLDGGPSKNNPGEPGKNVWQRIREGEVGPDAAWDAYRENLRYVLDDVERLLENVDAPEVVITSDHGNLFGEWFLYGHENGVLAPALRRVPWCRTSATDTGSVTPTFDESEPTNADDESVQKRLAELGYL
ncbi:hypothetical protein [Natrinema caseinilyticum]|uniref:hypothetical protein n=1 Tax=Natrinema caseinilyticum TaxID=2961570 RepID=UPI0020C4E040|nr:hypothetical protein [Natrinema caseinilyticum]